MTNEQIFRLYSIDGVESGIVPPDSTRVRVMTWEEFEMAAKLIRAEAHDQGAEEERARLRARLGL